MNKDEVLNKECQLGNSIRWHRGHWLYITDKTVKRHWIMWKWKAFQLWLLRKRYSKWI